MPELRYIENIGTILNDTLTGTIRTITFGNHGDDTLQSTAEQGETILIGGGGNDSYSILFLELPHYML